MLLSRTLPTFLLMNFTLYWSAIGALALQMRSGLFSERRSDSAPGQLSERLLYLREINIISRKWAVQRLRKLKSYINLIIIFEL